MKKINTCPFCKGTKIIKKGFRKKKHEKIRVYYCKHCQKKFTPAIHKGKTYPLKVILDAITHYHRFNSLIDSAKAVSEKYGLNIDHQNISNWLMDFKEYLTIRRMKDFIENKYPVKEIFDETRLFHGQIYDFKYHRAKTECILEQEYRHYKFKPIQEFLELVMAECPHQVFKESDSRASKYKGVFNLDGVKIKEKNRSYAVKNTRLVMQAVDNNKLRHQTLQEFMLFNDSVTVASEVPILLDQEDIEHYYHQLGFDIPEKLLEPKVITGHIDLIQVRNGAIYIMDFKPSAKKEKPIDQLMIYALAMSRLTGLRLFHFKCAWFDKDNYFEFLPLHVVHKKPKKRKKKRSTIK